MWAEVTRVNPDGFIEVTDQEGLTSDIYKDAFDCITPAPTPYTNKELAILHSEGGIVKRPNFTDMSSYGSKKKN